MEIAWRQPKAVVTIRSAAGEILDQFELLGDKECLRAQDYFSTFDTTEINKYIEILEKEVIMTSK